MALYMISSLEIDARLLMLQGRSRAIHSECNSYGALPRTMGWIEYDYEN